MAAFQRDLLGAGVPLAWVTDVGLDHAAHAAVQQLFMSGRLGQQSDLRFRPDTRLAPEDWRAWGGSEGELPPSRAAGAMRLAEIGAV
ncbi:MAG: hypothetical protein WDO24_20250 [Pseudomonadota bacterium]